MGAAFLVNQLGPYVYQPQPLIGPKPGAKADLLRAIGVTEPLLPAPSRDRTTGRPQSGELFDRWSEMMSRPHLAPASTLSLVIALSLGDRRMPPAMKLTCSRDWREHAPLNGLKGLLDDLDRKAGGALPRISH